MAERRILVCDQCGSENSDRWVIGRHGQTPSEVDLCESCSGLLSEITSRGRRYNPKKRTPYRKFTKVPVTPA